MAANSETGDPPLNPAIASALETAINGYLRLDPDAEAKLAALDGKVVCLQLTAPELTFYLLAGAGGVRVRHSTEDTVDVTVRASLTALLSAARTEAMSGSGAVGGQDIHLEGDMHTARTLQRVLRELEVDAEEVLARLIGDIPAHQLGTLGRSFTAWGRGAVDSLAQSGSEFLLHESAILTPRESVERFLHDVDRLRADVDRLQARVDRLRRSQ